MRSSEANPSEVISGLLRALVAQVGTVVEDVDGSVGELLEIFARLTRADPTKPCGHGQDDYQKVITAMQFHDRTEQRLRHVCRSLDEVAELLQSHDEELEAGHWHELAASLRRACAIENDKNAFDVAARVAIAGEAPRQPPVATGEIELF